MLMLLLPMLVDGLFWLVRCRYWLSEEWLIVIEHLCRFVEKYALLLKAACVLKHLLWW